MIASLFYALYPVSRFMLRRTSVVNSTMACHGHAVMSRISVKSEQILPVEHLGQSALSTEHEEKMSEQYSFDEDKKTPDAEQLICVSQKDTEIEAVLKTGEVQYSAKSEEDEQEIPKEEIGKVHHPLNQPLNTAFEGSEQHVPCPVVDLAKMELFEDSGNAADCSRHEAECWDEYTDVIQSSQTNSNWKQRSLLSNGKNHFDAQRGQHFPLGPGLVDEIRCPLWHIPPGSYHASVQWTRPCEVKWRLWQESSTEHFDTDVPFTKPSMDFTVMSYNILAQDLLEANMELYTHCPQEVLDWSNRCRLLLDEIHRCAPDILCLQEVQENHYQTQLYPVLTQMGYNCVYKRRTGNKTDGCATCYCSSRFSEVSVTPIEFFRPQTGLLDRHNVGIVLVLRPVVYQESKVRAKGSLLCVANTHLLFNPSRGDVKLAQLAILLAEIDNMIKSWRAKCEHCNVIMCGDFNSLPHMPLYQLITTGELHFQGLPAWMVSGQKDLSHKATCHRLFAPLWSDCLGISDSCQYVASCEVDSSCIPVTVLQPSPEGKRHYSHDFLLQLRFCPISCIRPSDLQLIPGVTDNSPDLLSRNKPNIRFRHILRHQLDLESTYKHIIADSGDPEITTLHSEGAATVDYIFYSPERTSYQAGQFGCEGLKLVGCLSLLSEDTLWSIGGLPSYIFPSDHLSLVAKFRLNLKAAVG
ncbi:protein angel homolog 1 isoform X2 [Syngnathoides biaculeatus]|uniref:protein angel homolog 1 isoform X2 n=1 Tax=Syngnathoides biaculeatus TaxID=300417 RepID=UPI002ADE488F|nr:protein angel homolog 1 isoform X2 [Syngnathoides biaculeatus]